jgi:hypothetical protein
LYETVNSLLMPLFITHMSFMCSFDTQSLAARTFDGQANQFIDPFSPSPTSNSYFVDIHAREVSRSSSVNTIRPLTASARLSHPSTKPSVSPVQHMSPSLIPQNPSLLKCHFWIFHNQGPRKLADLRHFHCWYHHPLLLPYRQPLFQMPTSDEPILFVSDSNLSRGHLAAVRLLLGYTRCSFFTNPDRRNPKARLSNVILTTPEISIFPT